MRAEQAVWNVNSSRSFPASLSRLLLGLGERRAAESRSCRFQEHVHGSS